MGTRYPNPRLIKIHRSYTAEEAARRLGKHKNTIREWIRRGLPICSEGWPILILGPDLRAFLQAQRVAGKRPCQPGEMYCLRCRAPKMPAGEVADYLPDTPASGKLVAICPDCDKLMNQRTSLARMKHFRGILDITIPQAMRHIVESA